jgi:hypothetical protein
MILISSHSAFPSIPKNNKATSVYSSVSPAQTLVGLVRAYRQATREKDPTSWPSDFFLSSPIRDSVRQFLMTMAVPERYTDRLVSLDRDCLLLRRYFPAGVSEKDQARPHRVYWDRSGNPVIGTFPTVGK